MHNAFNPISNAPIVLTDLTLFKSSKFKSFLRLKTVSLLAVSPCQLKMTSYIFLIDNITGQTFPSKREELEDSKKRWDQSKTNTQQGEQ